MSLKNDIIFSILCRREKLNAKQQAFVCDRIIKSRTPVEDLTKVHARAVTGDMCTCAYLRQNDRQKDNLVVCRITPIRAMRQITDWEYLEDLIKLNPENFDNFNHELLRKYHYETYLKVMVAYGDAIDGKIIEYKRLLSPNIEQRNQYEINLGRQNLMQDECKNAAKELALIESQRKEERIKKEEFAKEQADYILDLSEQVLNEKAVKDIAVEKDNNVSTDDTLSEM